MIQGLGNTNLYDIYNRIQYPKQNDGVLTGAVKPEAVGDGSEVNQESASAPMTMMDLKLDAIRPRSNASLEEVSLSLNKQTPFEMKPVTSDIKSLDIDKAVSDMQKDGALMQYQYFVGDQQPIFASDDGVVVAKTPGALL